MARTASASHGDGHQLTAVAAAVTIVGLAVSAFSVGVAALSRAGSASAPHAAAASNPVVRGQGSGQIRFEPNVGQTSPQVSYLTHADGGTVFLEPAGAVWAIPGKAPSSSALHPATGPASPGVALHMQFVGGNAATTMDGSGQLAGKVNYLLGSDQSAWHRNIPTYAQVVSHDVYPGVDLVWHGGQGHLEYDVQVAPGADLSNVAMSFDGATSVSIDSRSGDLVLQTIAGEFRQHAPQAFQVMDGGNVSVDSAFVMRGANVVGFQVGGYDATRPLIIDPVLGYSTLLGGSGVEGEFDWTDESFSGNSFPITIGGGGGNFDGGSGAIAVDNAGDAYVAGQSASLDFPTSAGAYQTGPGALTITKLNPTGSGIVYSTTIGPAPHLYGDPVFTTLNPTQPMAVAIDSQGGVAVVGVVESPFDSHLTDGYPVTPGAFYQSPGSNLEVGFVSKLDPTGSSLSFSTIVGTAILEGVGFDSADDLFVSGTEMSGCFTGGSVSIAATPGAYHAATQAGACPLFVQKFNPSATALLYSTFIDGGSECQGDTSGGRTSEPICPLAVDADGNAYVAGDTPDTYFPHTPGAFSTTGSIFVTKLNPTGSGLVYSTAIGGGASVQGITIDKSGRAVVAGSGSDVATTPGAWKRSGGFGGFVTEVNADGTGLVYSTLFDACRSGGVALTPGGDIWVTGVNCGQGPKLRGQVQEQCGCFYGQPYRDAFIAKFRPAGHSDADLLFATTLGGGGWDGPGMNSIAVDGAGNAYVTGQTENAIQTAPQFPTTPGSFQPTRNGRADLYVAKISQVCEVPIRGTVTGNVTVGSGGVACLIHAKVSGSVTVQRGGDLTIDSSTIGGSVTTNAASSVTICGSSVGAGVQVSGSTGFVRIGGPTCRHNSVTGDVVLKNNKLGLELSVTTVTGNVTVTNTTGTPIAEDATGPDLTPLVNPELEGDRISGNLTCSGNVLPPVNDTIRDHVMGAEVGQCAGL